MDKQKAAFLALLASIMVLITSVAYWYVTLPTPTTATKPAWLVLGAYMTYEQKFTWDSRNETEYMTWNITKITGETANLHVKSHGVDASGNITEGEAIWTINMLTRVILNSTDSVYDGKKTAFWIENTTTLGSYVQTMYGTAAITRNETITILGQQRQTWVTAHTWPTSTMQRYYDKTTGITLKIQVTLSRATQTIQITETATQTNINL